ncbi:MAG: hypothetical protein MZW92_72075 [Comamonadaceae bacterium]|nr:hypothetical protein [Comamonadaceae bacterium]
MTAVDAPTPLSRAGCRGGARCARWSAGRTPDADVPTGAGRSAVAGRSRRGADDERAARLAATPDLAARRSEPMTSQARQLATASAGPPDSTDLCCATSSALRPLGEPGSCRCAPGAPSHGDVSTARSLGAPARRPSCAASARDGGSARRPRELRARPPSTAASRNAGTARWRCDARSGTTEPGQWHLHDCTATQLGAARPLRPRGRSGIGTDGRRSGHRAASSAAALRRRRRPRRSDGNGRSNGNALAARCATQPLRGPAPSVGDGRAAPALPLHRRLRRRDGRHRRARAERARCDRRQISAAVARHGSSRPASSDASASTWTRKRRMLIQYQQSYQAAAKVLQIAQSRVRHAARNGRRRADLPAPEDTP